MLWASIALPPRRRKVLRHVRRHTQVAHSATNPKLRALCRRPTVSGRVAGRFSRMMTAASRSVVPFAWKTSASTISPLRFSTKRSRCNSTGTPSPSSCVPAENRDQSWTRRFASSASPRESSRWGCHDHPAEASACSLWVQSSSDSPRLPAACRPP